MFRKISMAFVVSGVLIFSACGSSSEDDSKEWSEKNTCEIVDTIRNDIRQTQLDVANGKLDLPKGMIELAMIQTRIELVQRSAPEGDLKASIDRWAASRQGVSDNPSKEAQLLAENDAAVKALEKKCE